jgi:hypothetical protein
MVNKRDAEVFIVCLSCHFDVGVFHVIDGWRVDDDDYNQSVGNPKRKV